MEEVWTGWVRWFDGKAVEHRIGRLIDFPPRLTREDLGHTDKTLWETDNNGHPRDPWAPSDRMVMRSAGDEADLLTFSTSSIGGRHALSKLCQQFDRHYANQDGMWPEVKLLSENYVHDQYGKIWKPKFQIVSWAYWDATKAPEDPKTLTAQALDDEIPFAKEWR